MTEEEKTTVEPMTKGQMAKKYGVDIKTLNRWLEPFKSKLGEPSNSQILTPAQVRIVYDSLGEPLKMY